MGGASTHILRAFIMSFGGPARAKHVAAAAAPTLAICWVMHQSTLRSGLQPATMSDEWQAASVGYLLARSTEENPEGSQEPLGRQVGGIYYCSARNLCTKFALHYSYCSARQTMCSL